jgi:hypothetical protein
VAVGTTLGSPTLVMCAVALSWFPTCALCHYVLRDMITVRTLIHGDGYLQELRRASWGMGVALLLSLLDGLLSAHYYRGATLGSYQAGALFTRAGYFGPQFVGILVYPRLAVPEKRKNALRIGVVASVVIGAFVTLVSVFTAGSLIDFAFGGHYTVGASFTLERSAWIFALAGAMQSLVQLAQLDAVARRSSAVGWLVLCGIGVELLTIMAVAHHNPIELITVAAVVATVTAVGGLVMAARSKHEAYAKVRKPGYLPATP